MAQQTPKLLQKFGRETVGRPDLAPSDFPVFLALKERVPGHFARGMKRHGLGHAFYASEVDMLGIHRDTHQLSRRLRVTPLCVFFISPMNIMTLI
jgi:hypothetical protein